MKQNINTGQKKDNKVDKKGTKMNIYKSPINGSKLSLSNIPGIMISDNDDIMYKIIENGSIVPLKSPINGSELRPSNIPGIMISDNDDVMYKVTKEGNIIPLKSPIHGGKLTPNHDGTIYDEFTGDIYEVNENEEFVIKDNSINKKSR